jgi:hypothetical protein
LERYEKPLI